ncbi:Actin-related protein 4 [Phytophthora citrophthora]|uniref:Actin-related protein 4 n=1 Tax=Phytophthora citrophthora TaxID=4793 RepID=A0AAD9LMM2_9STRA|nr:Actin-related protein 4 [Phytophthora citrophthora]
MYAGGGANEGDHHSSSSSVPFSSATAEANDLDALVFEFGTSRCKFGYAGEDFPRVFERPVPHDEVQDDEDLGRKLNLQAAQVESDPEKLAQWLFDASSSRLQTRMSEHPLLLVERPFTLPEEVTGDPGQVQDEQDGAKLETKTLQASSAGKKRDLKAREQMVEVVMEELGVPALFCAKSAVLACYANARTSGLVVEMGATYTSVTSVHEGYAFAYPKSQVSLFGGHDLDGFLRMKLAPQMKEQRAAATSMDAEIAKRKKQSWSYVVEAKESGLCRVADGPFDAVQNAQLPLINYELPDKTVIAMGTERFSVAEHYFLGETGIKSVNVSSGTDNSSANEGPGMRLPELICETGGLTTETELRKELFQNIVLTGGSSCFENMPTRIEREVVTTLSGTALPLTSSGNSGAGGFASSLRVKVVAAHTQERRVGSFLGGSILASLGSFHEMWMSKAEYAEHGAALIHKKCP